MLLLAAMRPGATGGGLGQVLRAEQALLFGRHEAERTVRRGLPTFVSSVNAFAIERGSRPPGGVVQGAVVDHVLARLPPLFHAEVVMWAV